MCNLYSNTMSREAMVRLFRISENRAGVWEPRTAIFPGYEAPVIMVGAENERELCVLRWGFVLRRPNVAPKRVTNIRLENAASPFWKASLEKRRCIVPATSYCEPHGTAKPTRWVWFAMRGGEERPPFAFLGCWTTYKGPLKKDGEPVEQQVFSFLTTTPNPLVESIDHDRMPCCVSDAAAMETWLSGSTEEAMLLARSYAADGMRIVQEGPEKKDLLAA